MENLVTNPQTGEVLFFNGTDWAPAKIAQNPQTGERVAWLADADSRLGPVLETCLNGICVLQVQKNAPHFCFVEDIGRGNFGDHRKTNFCGKFGCQFCSRAHFLNQHRKTCHFECEFRALFGIDV